MSIPSLVSAFYERIWNDGELQAVPELLTSDFSFRGSLGTELQGHAAFTEYVCLIREALAEYRCEIQECVAEGDRAFAKVLFSGRHVGFFRGFPPTSLPIHWQGAALFQFQDGRIFHLWVLGDLAGLDALLASSQTLPHGIPRE